MLKYNGTSWAAGNDLGGTSGAWSVSGSDINYTGGNVGIGTTEPSEKLHIEYGNVYIVSDVDVPITKPDTTFLRGLLVTNDGSSNVYQALRVVTNTDEIPIECLTVTNAGNVGIGTTEPAVRLEVDGYVSAFTSDGPGCIAVNDKRSDPESTWNLYSGQTVIGDFSINESAAFNLARLYIQAGGNVGIGIGDPDYKLDVDGDINCSGDYLISGTPVADYVFYDDYTVLSIEEHADAMWEHKHLPKVTGKDDLGNKPYSMSERREQILEELEIAHIYIERLYNEIKNLKAEIEELKAK